MSTRFVVAVAEDVAERVEAALALHVEASSVWWRTQQDRVRRIPDPGERRQARAVLEAERARRRRDGLHFDTKSSVIVHHVLAELAERGWTGRRWKPVPDGQAVLSGHPWGVERDSRGVLGGAAGRSGSRRRHRAAAPGDVVDLGVRGAAVAAAGSS
ncbi:hypothetical protein [Amycolatopsis stemonae]